MSDLRCTKQELQNKSGSSLKRYEWMHFYRFCKCMVFCGFLSLAASCPMASLHPGLQCCQGIVIKTALTVIA
ncbi:hypothetical protein CAP31_01545 [Sulfuriferula sp. AH1]|nr:hypothetical protein CAP31_01545 [Sulfuriferula sp. AH1]